MGRNLIHYATPLRVGENAHSMSNGRCQMSMSKIGIDLCGRVLYVDFEARWKVPQGQLTRL